MHEAEFEKHELEPFRHAIESVSRPCVAGSPTDDERDSFFGGMPLVDRDFVWPLNDGLPLDFIGQLKCQEIDLLPFRSGYLLFFYDNRHWGYSPNDRGHVRVLHQQGERQASESDLPEYITSSFFGLRKRLVRPKVYTRVNINFCDSRSYPSLERGSLSFDDEQWEEAYCEFCYDVEPLVQIGGYPAPIQSDCMEQDCVRAFRHGQADDWHLLLQLFEIGDMIWGDAGGLYWFIHRGDLQQGRLDRVWMVTQCH